MLRLLSTCSCNASLDCATFASASRESMSGSSASTVTAMISVAAVAGTLVNSSRNSFSKTISPGKNTIGKRRDASERKARRVSVRWDSWVESSSGLVRSRTSIKERVQIRLAFSSLNLAACLAGVPCDLTKGWASTHPLADSLSSRCRFCAFSCYFQSCDLQSCFVVRADECSTSSDKLGYHSWLLGTKVGFRV